MPFPSICLNDKQHRPNEWPTFRFKQNTSGEQTVTLHDDVNKELQLDSDIHRVYLYAVEGNSSPTELFCVEGTIVDAPAGKVTFEVTECHVARRGLFLAKIFVRDITQQATDCSPEETSMSSASLPSVFAPEDAKNIRQYLAYVEVETDWTIGSQRQIGVTIAEVRLALRDLSLEDNFLLDDVEFTDTEIAWAMRRPVDEWNETPPKLSGHVYTFANFPYRYNWLNAVKAELLIIAAAAYRRNELPYQAAGLSVNDKNKASEYENIAQNLKAEWRRWVLLEKKSINFSKAFSSKSLRSYGNYPYYYKG